MKLPSFSTFIKYELYSNIAGTLTGPFINYLLGNKIMELDMPYLLLLVNATPLFLGLIKSLMSENCCPAREGGDQEQVRNDDIIINTAVTIIIHGSNIAGILTENKTLAKFNESALVVAAVVVAYIGGKIINRAKGLATSGATIWTERRQSVSSSDAESVNNEIGNGVESVSNEANNGVESADDENRLLFRHDVYQV